MYLTHPIFLDSIALIILKKSNEIGKTNSRAHLGPAKNPGVGENPWTHLFG